MPAIHFRPLTIGDYHAAVDLWSVTEGLAPVEEREPLRCFLEHNPGLSPSAWADHRLVGVLLVGFDGMRGLLSRLAVAADHRGQGIATALVDRAAAALRERGARRAMALVLEDNTGAQAFWHRLEWTHHGSVHLFGHRLGPEE